jgi:hypothetical protein
MVYSALEHFAGGPENISWQKQSVRFADATTCF